MLKLKSTATAMSDDDDDDKDGASTRPHRCVARLLVAHQIGIVVQGASGRHLPARVESKLQFWSKK